MSKIKSETYEPIDFTKIELVRGETPDGIEQQCLQLCRDYLAGDWNKVTVDEIVVKRMSGGLTNQLYHCTIKEDNRRADAKEPQEVAIRFYQKKHFNTIENLTDERLPDTIVGLLASENGLGPKIYGIFESGQIQKFYKHKQFRAEEQKDPKLVEQVFKSLARLHAMEVPVKKTGNWIYNYCQMCFNHAYEVFDIDTIIQENNLKNLKEQDFGKEWQWLNQMAIDIDSPVTFTHIDFRGSNIMVTETDGIVLCDFEYSCYGFRGFDFGSIVLEWGRQRVDWDKPLEVPEDNVIKNMIEIYIDESVRLKGKEFSDDPRNSMEHILKEVKVFALMGMMFFMMFKYMMDCAVVPTIPFDKTRLMIETDRDFKTYLDLKQKFKEQNVFA